MSGGIGVSGHGTNKLTDRSVKAFLAAQAKGAASKTKLSDGGGLYITVTPAGTPVWRLKYRLGGREKVYAVGTYPAVTLEAARIERDLAKALIKAGRDPVQTRQTMRADNTAAADNTFESVALEWLAKRQAAWSATHFEKSKRALERDVFPALGKLPVQDITTPMIAGAIVSIEERGARDTAGRVLQHVTGVFRFARARGLREGDNPAAPVAELLTRVDSVSKRPALLDIEALRDVLRRAELENLSPSVRLANRLIAFTGVRIWNAVAAEWSEFDLESPTPVWTIPRNKMKVKRGRDFDHKVLLGPTITAELKAWRKLTGGGQFVFPSPTGRAHITRESIEKVYRVTLGLADVHSPHGWRASFKTLAKDSDQKFERDAVELALDHVHASETARAYDRGERLAERQRLANWWDEQLAPRPKLALAV